MQRLLAIASLILLPVLVGPSALRAEEPAIRPGEGLPLIDWKDAGKFIGKQVIVQGRIEATGHSKSIIFLNFDRRRSFTAIIRKKHESSFPKSPEAMYAGRLVQIRGRISTFKDKPQIEVTRPDQVTIVDKLGEPVAPEGNARPPRQFEGIVSIATYNVLNLFDAHDDPYHDDEGTNQKPRAELERLAATIRQTDADVLALQEVENRGIMEEFVRAMLGGMGYEHVVCYESNDGRGIDCAILSRFPVGPVTSYRHLRFDDGHGGKTRFRRDLLRARIEPPSSLAFDVYVVHLKSKRGAGESEDVRMAETKAIRQILDAELAKDPKSRFVLCGDFNDTWDSNPIKQVRGEGDRALVAFAQELPANTITYNKSPHQSMIDFILCSPQMASRYVAKSIRVIEGTVATSGSDHNPVLMRFDVRPAADDAKGGATNRAAAASR